MFKRAAQQRLVAWLALVAMALIVLMPVVSRTMPMDGAMAGMSSGSTDQCHLHAGHQHPGVPAHPDDPTARCGYCVLLSHTPVLGCGTALVVLPTHVVSFVPVASLPSNVPAEPLLSARPRGPPLLANG
ncbi:DUF2946 domain-containing protein [Dyella monticola]|uniref:DUF2946 domain-containing protein n=1 Tax=Dyella monticola TaxID=1927958 RepID=A0A370WSM1_9GAMM|nr:DUF2946 domain-containing protein [Dyella monticola]RDS79120.1 DUF2946 domain-containing protein [Dyella monticola]